MEKISEYLDASNNPDLQSYFDISEKIGALYATRRLSLQQLQNHINANASINISQVTGYTPYSLPISDATTLGGVKIGSGITVAPDGTISVSATPGGIAGSGAADYLARWTPDGSTLGNSIIRDNGTNIGISAAPNAGYKVFLNSSLGGGIWSAVTSGPNDAVGVLGRGWIVGGTHASGNTGLVGQGYASAVLNIGVSGEAIAFNEITPLQIGGKFSANGTATADTGIGVYAEAINHTNNYAIQLKDGTETVGGGKFLKDTGDGKANWANISFANIAGAVGGTGLAGTLALWTGTNNISYNSGITHSTINGGLDPLIGILGTSSSNSAISMGAGTIGQASDGSSQFRLSTFSSFNNYPIIELQRQFGTRATPSNTPSANSLGQIRWSGGYGEGAAIESITTETHTTGQAGSRMIFRTTPNGSITPAARMEIDQNGNVGIGATGAIDAKLFMYATTANDLLYGGKAGNNGSATAADKTGFYAYANGTGSAFANIGGRFDAAGNSNANHALQLRDTTEAIGKVLTSVTADGKTNWAYPKESAQMMGSDLATAITADAVVKKSFWIAPTNGTITEVFADLDVSQASGLEFTIDIKKNGTSIFSTLLTFDNSETSTRTATTAAVISTASFVKGDKFAVYVTQVGNGTAKGLLTTINYNRLP